MSDCETNIVKCEFYNTYELKAKHMKLIEKTPKSMMCGPMAACPAVFETDHNTYIVIGTQLASDQIENLLKGRINSKETAVEFPKKLLSQILPSVKNK